MCFNFTTVVVVVVVVVVVEVDVDVVLVEVEVVILVLVEVEVCSDVLVVVDELLSASVDVTGSGVESCALVVIVGWEVVDSETVVVSALKP